MGKDKALRFVPSGGASVGRLGTLPQGEMKRTPSKPCFPFSRAIKLCRHHFFYLDENSLVFPPTNPRMPL